MTTKADIFYSVGFCRLLSAFVGFFRPAVSAFVGFRAGGPTIKMRQSIEGAREQPNVNTPRDALCSVDCSKFTMSK